MLQGHSYQLVKINSRMGKKFRYCGMIFYLKNDILMGRETSKNHRSC